MESITVPRKINKDYPITNHFKIIFYRHYSGGLNIIRSGVFFKEQMFFPHRGMNGVFTRSKNLKEENRIETVVRKLASKL